VSLAFGGAQGLKNRGNNAATMSYYLCTTLRHVTHQTSPCNRLHSGMFTLRKYSAPLTKFGALKVAHMFVRQLDTKSHLPHETKFIRGFVWRDLTEDYMYPGDPKRDIFIFLIIFFAIHS